MVIFILHLRCYMYVFALFIIKEIIIIKLYAIIVCNIWRYCTQLYAINLIIIESHD